MSIYKILISLISAFVFTACTPAPEVPLSPELSQYTLAKENCEKLRTTPGIYVPDALDKECLVFLKRLDKANALDYKIAHFNDGNTDPNARPKPEYILMQSEGYRQHLKSKLDYQELTDTVNQVSLEAIADDRLADVELTLSFPETLFTKAHYLYYKKYAPRFDADPQYLAYEKQYAQELVKKGLAFLSEGDKNSALTLFKEAAAIHSAQAEYLAGIVYEAKHIDKAIEWHTRAQEHGIKGSRIQLARLYSRQHEPKESQKWYLLAAEDGDAHAQFILYEQYAKTVSDKTLAIAARWLKSAAENGFPPAEYAYAEQLLKKNKAAEAKTWLLKAKEHGVTAADAPLGSIFFKERQYSKAYPLLDSADTAAAKYQLGKMFEQGLGVKADYYSAYMLYKEAYRLGLKGAKKDMARVDKLKTEREEAHYEAAKRREGEYQKELTKRCGEKITNRNIRTAGETFYLHGLIELPLENADGYLLNTEDGRKFLVTGAVRADTKQFQHVNITAKSTGNSLTISDDNDARVTIYQLSFQKECQR